MSAVQGLLLQLMEGQSELSELSVISWMSTAVKRGSTVQLFQGVKFA